MDPSGLIEAIASGFSMIPSAVLAALFLALPTAIWLIARITNPPDPAKRELVVEEHLLWVCSSCRSINEARLETCYRCHRLRAGESTPNNVDGGQEGEEGVGIAVGPGLPVELESLKSWLRGDDDTDVEDSSLGFEPVLIEPKVKASSRPSAGTPTGRTGRRQPKASGEVASKRKPKNRAS